MARQTKKEIYAEYGIVFDRKMNKIYTPIGETRPLLVRGNHKLGLDVWHFSTLATNKAWRVNVNGCAAEISGTCGCHCPGCYAEAGRYAMPSVQSALAVRTIIARSFTDFFRRAIIAQIHADKIRYCRIHAAGDFFSAEYIQAWREIVQACPGTVFWSYTKFSPAEVAFDDMDNCNIVRSLLPGGGLNYGHAGYILDKYAELSAAGESVYICRCGVDPMQHCSNCKGCSAHKYVLFLEHGTEYDGPADPLFPRLRDVIDAQPPTIAGLK